MSRLNVLFNRNQWRKDKALSTGQKSYEHITHFPLRIRHVQLWENIVQSENFQNNLKGISELKLDEK